MWRNFFKSSTRNLLKERSVAFINVFGLAISLGCALVVYSFINLENNANSYHENSDDIYLVLNRIERNNNSGWWGMSPVGMRDAIENSIPQVLRSARLEIRNGVVRKDDNRFYESFYFVDPVFMEMFDFPAIDSKVPLLSQPNDLVLTEEMAIKYFGNIDHVVGNTLSVMLGDVNLDFNVVAILKSHPHDSGFRFDFILPLSQLSRFGKYDENSWTELSNATFIQAQKNTDVKTIIPSFKPFKERFNAQNGLRKIEAWDLKPLSNIFKESYKYFGSVVGNTDPMAKVVLSILAIILLTLSSVNYVNIALTSAERRVKEIGIRKTLGSTQSNLVLQYLLENALLCTFSLFLGLGLAFFFLLPGMGYMLGFSLSIDFSTTSFWMFIISLLVAITLISGLYPALYISSFQPIVILRDRLKFRESNWFQKLFQMFQFILAFVALCLAVVFSLNNNYQKERPWGYDNEHLAAIKIEGQNEFVALVNGLNNNPIIASISGSKTHVGWATKVIKVRVEEHEVDVVSFEVGSNYLEQLSIPLVEGQTFEPDFSMTRSNTVVVSERFIEAFQIESPIGQTIQIDGEFLNIIGLVKDIHYNDFQTSIRPAVYRLVKQSDYEFASIKFVAGFSDDYKTQLLTKAWNEINSELPLILTFQKNLFDDYYKELDLHRSLVVFVGVMALILALMGLYAFATSSFRKRLKQLCIRKVLGASPSNLVKVSTKPIFGLLGWSLLISTPLAFMLTRQILDQFYVYHISLDMMPLLLSISVLLLAAVFTVASELRKLLRAEPASVLHHE